jgi:hypothetical protein
VLRVSCRIGKVFRHCQPGCAGVRFGKVTRKLKLPATRRLGGAGFSRVCGAARRNHHHHRHRHRRVAECRTPGGLAAAAAAAAAPHPLTMCASFPDSPIPGDYQCTRQSCTIIHWPLPARPSYTAIATVNRSPLTH